MRGFELTTEQIVEILSVYATADQAVEAVVATPGWRVIGAFVMPVTWNVLLDVLGSVSDPSLVGRVRLYCVTPGSIGVVGGALTQLTSTVDAQAFSGVFTLEGGKAYQFQAEVTGGAGDGLMGFIRRATLDGVET